MFKTYVTQPGDTFSSISRAITGSERNAALIKSQNPQAVTPIIPGTSIMVKTGGKSDKGFSPFGLDVKIDGASYEVYDNFTCSMAIDGFSRSQFVMPNEKEIRDILPPLTPTAIDIGYNGNGMMSGYCETPTPENTDTRKELRVSVASWPNMLLSTPPTSSFPWEFVDMDLELITKNLLALYSLEYEFEGDKGPVFSKLSIKQSDKVFDFLSNLCKQRGLIMRDDEDGKVIFHTGDSSGGLIPIPTQPVLEIDGENRPDVAVGPAVYDSTEYYSHVTGILKSKNKRKRKRLTVENPHYRGIMRPYEFEISDSDEGELETAVNTVAARMFASVFKLEITVPYWEDKNGDLLRPGGLVSARSTKDYIEDFTDLLISNVTLNVTGTQRIATLTTVLPGVYNGKIPERVPWT